MSSRVLRKLQGDKDIVDEISDTETDIPVSGGARRKQLNINRYDLLNQQSHSESEVKEDDNETEAAKSCEGDPNHEAVKRKKKKKKKKSGKHVNPQRSSEDNADIDEVERSVREVNRLLGESHLPKTTSAPPFNTKHEKNVHNKNILSVQHKHLNPNNELKKIFGSKIIQAEHKRKNRGRGHTKTTWLVSGKDTWPQVGKSGLSMNLLENKQGIQYFTYEHSQSYRQIQNRFLESVESLNPDNIVAIINDHPYHIDALIQLSDLCKLSEDLAMAAEFIERALYCLECAFHPLFNVAQGNCRLDYRRQENRALYITIFKHLTFVGGRACCRTALEFCKLLLSLDPDGDPLAIKLAIDFYALRAREYNWLIDFADEWETAKNLSQLPNFAFSTAVAHFHTSNGETAKADSLLQNALLMFPGVLMPLLEKCSVQIDNRVMTHKFFSVNENKQSAALTQLIQLYVSRCYHVWKDSDLMHWLERNVHAVLDRVDKNDPVVKDYETKRAKRYQGSLPRSIARHILLSDIKDLTPITDDFSGPVLGFDPLPPQDSINIYTKPKRPTVSNNSSIPLSIFFRSILPNFNPNQIPPNLLDPPREEDGAAALPVYENANNDAGDFRRSVVSLVGAMRDLLNNIRPPEMEVPNDADVDEDYDDLT
ncbi:ribosome quality control complex subunit TCF25 [Tribolium castaneum]|uniref:Transcription factor 25-like Protein n=1 Tax=Tribolium castaneum TaxID=7070 RepID=D6WGX1_TRICA|nr:PREDICTED: transcription factor 25 [Tribolium castaneum]EFA01445.2 Transcription factor 25-like Protein [Tribolium castaneum]|eukprot:XP_008190917.1 PREDICTED: transcription factor 25 [Tribolium castaneum]